MVSLIFCTVTISAVLIIIYNALGAIGARRLQIPLILLIGAVSLVSISFYLSPGSADVLRVVVGLSLIAWMIYVFVSSQIEPKRRSDINLTDDQKKKIHDLAKEVMSQVGSGFDISDPEGKDLEFEEVRPEKKPGKPSGLIPEDMVPLPTGTKVSTPEGNGVIELYIPTLEMVYKTEDYRDVRGYRIRLDDNNIKYFRMSDVQQK